MTIGGGKGSADLLRQRAVNRALLERQLRRVRRPAAEVVEHLVACSQSASASRFEVNVG